MIRSNINLNPCNFYMLFKVTKTDLPHRSNMSSFRRSHLVSYACLSILSEMSADWTSNPSSRSITESTLFTIMFLNQLSCSFTPSYHFLTNFLIAYGIQNEIPCATGNVKYWFAIMSAQNVHQEFLIFLCSRRSSANIHLPNTSRSSISVLVRS